MELAKSDLTALGEEVDVLPRGRFFGHYLIGHIVIVVIDEVHNIVYIIQIDLESIVLCVDDYFHLSLLTLDFKVKLLFSFI